MLRKRGKYRLQMVELVIGCVDGDNDGPGGDAWWFIVERLALPVVNLLVRV